MKELLKYTGQTGLRGALRPVWAAWLITLLQQRHTTHVTNPSGLTFSKWQLRCILQPSEEIFFSYFCPGATHHKLAFEKAREETYVKVSLSHCPSPGLQKHWWIRAQRAQKMLPIGTLLRRRWWAEYIIARYLACL